MARYDVNITRIAPYSLGSYSGIVNTAPIGWQGMKPKVTGGTLTRRQDTNQISVNQVIPVLNIPNIQRSIVQDVKAETQRVVVAAAGTLTVVPLVTPQPLPFNQPPRVVH